MMGSDGKQLLTYDFTLKNAPQEQWKHYRPDPKKKQIDINPKLETEKISDLPCKETRKLIWRLKDSKPEPTHAKGPPSMHGRWRAEYIINLHKL